MTDNITSEILNKAVDWLPLLVGGAMVTIIITTLLNRVGWRGEDDGEEEAKEESALDKELKRIKRAQGK